MKKIVLFLACLFTGISLCRAQGTSSEETKVVFKNFKIIPPQKSFYKDVRVVPLDIEQAIAPLQKEAFEKQFDLGYGFDKDNLVNWLYPDIERKDSLDYWDVYGEWQELIPEEFEKRLKDYWTNLREYRPQCFAVHAIVNNKGDVLSVFFQIDSRMVDVIKEEDLLWFSDTIKRKGIDPSKFSFRHWSVEDGEEFDRKMKAIPESNRDERRRLHELKRQGGTESVYGIINLIGIGEISWREKGRNFLCRAQDTLSEKTKVVFNKFTKVVFNNFKTITSRWGQVEDIWVVPLDIEQAITSLQKEALEKQFDLGYGFDKDNLVHWLQFSIGRKDSLGYGDVYGEWQKLIPGEFEKRLKDHWVKLGLQESDRDYFAVFAIVNHKGKVLSVYFRIDSRLVEVIDEEDLLWFSDTIKRKGIDPSKFSFQHWLVGEGEEFVKKMKAIPESNSKERLRLMHEFVKQGTDCVYGIICLCGIGGNAVVPVTNHPHVEKRKAKE